MEDFDQYKFVVTGHRVHVSDVAGIWYLP